MERLLVLLGSVLFVAFCRELDVCKENNCPHFTVVFQTEDYEERNYDATDWMSTKIENDNVLAAHSKLMDYRKRQKEKGFNLAPDTWPVLVTNSSDGTLYMSWFLSPGTIKPENNDPEVKLESRPAGTLYVRVFRVKPSPEEVKKTKELLQEALEKSGKDFDHNSFNCAAFQSYYALTQHNEIWIQASKHD